MGSGSKERTSDGEIAFQTRTSEGGEREKKTTTKRQTSGTRSERDGPTEEERVNWCRQEWRAKRRTENDEMRNRDEQLKHGDRGRRTCRATHSRSGDRRGRSSRRDGRGGRGLRERWRMSSSLRKKKRGGRRRTVVTVTLVVVTASRVPCERAERDNGSA